MSEVVHAALDLSCNKNVDKFWQSKLGIRTCESVSCSGQWISRNVSLADSPWSSLENIGEVDKEEGWG